MQTGPQLTPAVQRVGCLRLTVFYLKEAAARITSAPHRSVESGQAGRPQEPVAMYPRMFYAP